MPSAQKLTHLLICKLCVKEVYTCNLDREGCIVLCCSYVEYLSTWGMQACALPAAPVSPMPCAPLLPSRRVPSPTPIARVERKARGHQQTSVIRGDCLQARGPTNHLLCLFQSSADRAIRPCLMRRNLQKTASLLAARM